MRVEIVIDKLSLIEWLDHQLFYPKIYWESSKDGLFVAGIGSALAFAFMPIFADSKAPRFFGGESFCQDILVIQH